MTKIEITGWKRPDGIVERRFLLPRVVDRRRDVRTASSPESFDINSRDRRRYSVGPIIRAVAKATEGYGGAQSINRYEIETRSLSDKTTRRRTMETCSLPKVTV